MSQYTANQKLQNLYFKMPILNYQFANPEKHPNPDPPKPQQPPVIKEVPQIFPKDMPIKQDVPITPPNKEINTAPKNQYHSVLIDSNHTLEENY